jgi:hypothetical protein
VAHLFPELSAAELSQALQVATAAAEKKVPLRNCSWRGDKLWSAIQA